MLIDIAAPDDAGALAALAAETFPLACPPDTTPGAIAEFVAANLSAEAFTGHLRNPDDDVVTARTEGRLDGYALARHGAPPPDLAGILGSGPVTYLSKLYVRPGVIGGGTGYALLGHVRDLAQARASALIWLGTNQENTRAQRFYERNGFERIGERQFVVGGNVENDYVFALKL